MKRQVMTVPEKVKNGGNKVLGDFFGRRQTNDFLNLGN